MYSDIMWSESVAFHSKNDMMGHTDWYGMPNKHESKCMIYLRMPISSKEAEQTRSCMMHVSRYSR
jgi:hypothetical protein